ncbi:MAG: DegT/DnrJ/EryC1/StrS family aminotransferase [Clostridia bacterium]|nr:DegT/DnrJ/EryC1/StrS family aminotransferase [Clostridia bacterium]
MQFRDLKKQYEVLKTDIDSEIDEVIASSGFISGKKVKELEEKLAEYVGVKHCITCANGTDALTLALKAWGIGEGDAVFVPDFTFFSSGECPAAEGAAPVFIDVCEDTFNIDPEKLEQSVIKVKEEGKYDPKVVIAVDLFGLPADYTKIKPICEKYGLLLLEDGAQGFGGEINGKKACSFGDISTTSFFPAKPLGCYGDGGAVFTDNDEWAAMIRSLAVHGKSGEDKYNNIRLGLNSRLDTIQAGILLPKLKAFKDFEIDAVNKVAKLYNSKLCDTNLKLPVPKDGFVSSWAQYTVILPDGTDRAALQAKLKEKEIPSMVYYIKPMHLQGAFQNTDSAKADCPETERLSKTVLSLPMHPYLDEETVTFICNTIKANS